MLDPALKTVTNAELRTILEDPKLEAATDFTGSTTQTMAQMTDNWDSVESWYAQLDELAAWRPTVAAMRRLIAAIRADRRFHDLAPSTSHEALVFRRAAKHAVVVSWQQDGTYSVAFVEHPFELRQDRRVGENDVIEVLLEYLDQAPP